MRGVVALLVAASCSTPVETGELDGVDVSFHAADVWSGAVAVGGSAPFELVVSSPLTPDGGAFYVQDADGGPRSGARVELWALAATAVPAPGAVFRAELTVVADDVPPVLALLDGDDLEIVGVADLLATAWSGDPELAGALVRVDDLTVTSPPDPGGRADTDAGVGLDGTLGVQTAGFLARGNLIGVATSAERIAPRTGDDWDELDPAAGPTATTIAAIREGQHPDGAFVELADVTAISPWSRDGRYQVVQDVDGRGLWLDFEGFAVERESAVGDVMSLLAEVRPLDGTPALRSWWSPEVTGAREPQLSGSAADGALLEAVIDDLGPPDALGRRETADGLVLDDTFVDLADVEPPVRVQAVIRGESTAVLHVTGLADP